MDPSPFTKRLLRITRSLIGLKINKWTMVI